MDKMASIDVEQVLPKIQKLHEKVTDIVARSEKLGEQVKNSDDSNIDSVRIIMNGFERILAEARRAETITSNCVENTRKYIGDVRELDGASTAGIFNE